MFGVSFMGGDPCASSYNDDPFDEQDARPDAMIALCSDARPDAAFEVSSDTVARKKR